MNAQLVHNVRNALDAEGFNFVKIVVSGGFDAARIREFEVDDVPTDAYAVGSAFFRGQGEFDFTADIVALGLISHAQPRYIFFGLTLLLILGIEVIRRAIETRRVIAAAAATAVVVSWFIVVNGQLKRDGYRLETTAATRAAAAAIRADAGGAPCLVVGDAFTQLEWYSGCASSSPTCWAMSSAPSRATSVHWLASTPEHRRRPWTSS